MRRLTAIAAVLLVAALFAPPFEAASAAEPYNVVILVSDDQRADKVTPEYMPRVWNRLVVPGTMYADAFVPNALCCPSRASILTGDHSHTTGVWANVAPYGGFSAFDDASTIATDFQAAGYRTGLIGKYLNGYDPRSLYIPPGWNRWFATANFYFYDYLVNSNGRLLTFGSEPEDYGVRVTVKKAVSFVRSAQNAGQPFFLYYAFGAPHSPAIPDPRDVNRFAGETRSAFFDDMLESAYSMDRAIGTLLNNLPPRTIVVFLSDNGFLWGERKGTHGSLTGKVWPFDQSIRIPLVIHALDGSITFPDRSMALNVDLRETVEAAALGTAPTTDGINLLTGTRTVFPVEHLNRNETGLPPPPSYCGAREEKWLYVRYGNGLEELFRQPNERENLVTDPTYHGAYVRLKDAAVTLCNPVPPGYTWG
jgi:N-acetylglucosamine-6-sulfatase